MIVVNRYLCLLMILFTGNIHVPLSAAGSYMYAATGGSCSKERSFPACGSKCYNMYQCPLPKINGTCDTQCPCNGYNGKLRSAGADMCSLSRGYGRFRTDDTCDSNILVATNETTFLLGYCYFCAVLDLSTSLTGQFVPLHNGTSTCQNHSHGLLCGYCDDGYYRNLGGRCVTCDNSRVALDWFLYLASQILPITILFFTLILTHHSLVGGTLNSAIFFAQMVTTTMDLNGDGFIPVSNLTNGNPHIAYGVESVYHLIYQPFNLNFFYPFVEELCLLKTSAYLPYLALQYIVAFYPLVLIGIVLFANWLDNRNVTITEKCRMFFRSYTCINPTNLFQPSCDVFASFILLSYQKFVLISAMLISFNRLIDDNGDTARYVPLYDPSSHYFSDNHIVYAVIAILIYLYTFALPILLVVMYHKQRQRCKWINLILKPFQKHYRQRCNGNCCKYRYRLHDSRWVAGLYFFLRLGFITIFVFSLSLYSLIVQFVLQQLVCLVVAVFFFIYQPYAKSWHNKLDAFFFLLLAFINTLSIYQYYLTTDDKPLSLPAFIAQYILIFVPFLWMVGCCIYKVYKYCHGDRSESRPVRDGDLTYPPSEDTTVDDSVPLTPSGSGSSIASSIQRSKGYGATDNQDILR